MAAVMRVREIDAAGAASLLAGFGLRLVLVPEGAGITGTYWGEPEAGLSGDQLFVRPDTPVHSLLHEAAHYLCMPPARRAGLHRDAGGDVAEEDAVCYLQVLLAAELTGEGWSRDRLFADMDAWGYSFRLGSARRWFEEDADEALAWLRDQGLVHPTGSAIKRLPRKNQSPTATTPGITPKRYRTPGCQVMDLADRTALITGGARGMGRVAAIELARLGARVIIVDWEGETGTRTRDYINRLTGRQAAEFVYCDLSSLGAVRALAADVQARYPALHILMCNAGITDPVRRLSVDGWEMHLATCHLGHFLLTHLLLDLLKKSAPARIVNISSDAHKAGPGLDFDDLNNERIWKGREFSNRASFTAYHRAKLCNVYVTLELAERLRGTGVTVNAVSPGYFVNTTIYRNLTGAMKWGSWLVFGIGTLLRLNTPEKGARTHLYVSSSPDIQGVSGKYFAYCKEAEPSPLARDAGIRRRLWAWTAQVTGVGG